MLRALVKNSFIVASVEDFAEETPCQGRAPRARSADALRSAGEQPGSLLTQIERLTQLLNFRKPASLPTPPTPAACVLVEDAAHWGIKAAPAPTSEQEQQQPLLQASAPRALSKNSGLKTVDSNNSVSTMCPQDWDVVEDDDCEGEDCTAEGVPRTALAGQAAAAATSRSFHHSRVPKSHNLAQEFLQTTADAATTMMLRNIPNRYSQKELIKELETLGFAGSFDFFYSPIDTGSMGNVGYAFVNFIDSDWAYKCMQMVSGYAFKKHQRKANIKVASVSVAHLQGLEANIRHYENAAVNGRSRAKRCGPVIMTSIAVMADFNGAGAAGLESV